MTTARVASPRDVAEEEDRLDQRPSATKRSDDAASTSANDVPEEYAENASAVIRETLDSFLEYVETWAQKTRETADNLGEEGVSNRGPRWSGNGTTDAIVLNGDPRENIRIEDLVTCENALLSKTTMILAHLGGEVERLSVVADETIYPMLTTFGERANDSDAMSDAELRDAFVGKLEPFQDALLFMDQVRAVVCNLFTQLTVVYSTFAAYTPYQTVRLAWSFDMLGRALAIGVGIDEVVRNNRALRSALMNFKRVVLLLRANPEQFGMNEVDVVSLDSAVAIVENQLLSSSVFASVLTQLTETEQPDRFIKELAGTTLELLESTTARLNTDTERLNDKRTLLSCLCLTILHSGLVPDIADRKLCMKAWEVHKVCVLVSVTTTVSVCPGAILEAHLSPAARECFPDNGLESVVSFRRETLETLDETFPAKLLDLLSASVAWLTKFTATPNVSHSLSSTMNARVSLFQEGMRLVNRLRHYTQEIIHLHVSLEAPVTKRRVRLIARAVEMLHAMCEAFTQNLNLSLEVQHVLKFLADRILRMMVRLKRF